MNINLGNGASQVEIVDVRNQGESRSVRGRIAPQTGANGASLQGMVALTIRGDRLSGTIATNQRALRYFRHHAVSSVNESQHDDG